jgi:ABC-2 type transport system permease protein
MRKGAGVRLYWELVWLGFRRTAAYRTAAISGAITNTFFGFLRAYVFIALYQTRSDAGGYSLEHAQAYAFITQGLAALIALWSWWQIAETIQTGEVAIDLSRPYDYLLAWLAQDYGRAAYQFGMRTVPPTIVGMIAFGFALPTDPMRWLLVVPSLLLAIAASFGWRFCLNLTAFWFTDYRGVAGLSILAPFLMSGIVVPRAMWPDGIRQVMTMLPFAAMVAIPVDIFLGKLQGPDLVAAFALQAFWAVALLVGGKLMLAVALRKLVIQGG